MEYKFQVENIRCDGCANTITKKLKAINGVESVDVSIESKKVVVTTTAATDDQIHDTLSKRLAKLGYPEAGTKGDTLKAKAASVVSCAIGKVSSNN